VTDSGEDNPVRLRFPVVLDPAEGTCE